MEHMMEEKDVLALANELIRHNSLTLGKYKHFSVCYKRLGQRSMASLLDEMAQNLVDEIDELYTFIDKANRINGQGYAELLILCERKKRDILESFPELCNRTEPVEFQESMALSLQHERILTNKLMEIADESNKET